MLHPGPKEAGERIIHHKQDDSQMGGSYSEQYFYGEKKIGRMPCIAAHISKNTHEKQTR